jgi:DNA-binding CsgD family transcriptional regulator
LFFELPIVGARGQELDVRLKKLTEREKEALRLLLKGFDVKTCARELNVSSNTITERLRSARTKLGVTSSREAARILIKAENADPILYGDMFSAVETVNVNLPFSSLPDQQAEEKSLVKDNRVREAPLAFQMQPELFVPMPGLPLRQPGDLRNSLSKKQRVYAIFDLTVKLSTVIALISVLALVLNMFLGTR